MWMRLLQDELPASRVDFGLPAVSPPKCSGIPIKSDLTRAGYRPLAAGAVEHARFLVNADQNSIRQGSGQLPRPSLPEIIVMRKDARI